MKRKFESLIRKIKRIKYINDISEKWREIHTIMIFFIFCFSILIWKLFSYTVLDYKFYTTLADNQQIGTFSVPVNRGVIYSSIERGNSIGEKASFLATSVNLYDLAIDPNFSGNKEKLGEFLINIVYDETCLNKTSEKCKNNLLKFLQVLDLEDFDNSTEYVKKKIGERIIPRIMQKKVTNVTIGTEYTEEQVAKVKNLNISGFYFGNNSISVNPEEYSQTDESLLSISSIIGITPEELKTITRKRDLKYVSIFRKISINSSEKIKDIIKEEIDAIKKAILTRENSIYGFFIMDVNPSRYYPEGDIASQVVGFIDSEGIGRYGLEGYFDTTLKGNNGKIVARKDVRGRIIDTISLEKDDLLSEGVKVVTTIDRNIQKKVESVLKSGVIQYRSNKGSIVVMEPKTGRVLAMANYPTFDLNNFGDVYELEKVTRSKYPNPANDLLGYPVFVEDNEEGNKLRYDNKEIFLREATFEELGNQALVKYKYKNGFGPGVYKNDVITGLYEPGSIMKAVTVAIGLDTGEIDINSKYDDRGSVKIDNFEIKNESRACLGYHTFGHALNYSCNVGMIRIVQRIGKALAAEYFEAFGFGDPTGIELEGELYAPLGAWEKWPMANLFTKSYGLGISATPLQMAAAYNVLANGGIYVKPRIIEKIIYPNGTEIEYKTEGKRRVIKQETSDIMRKMLQDGVDNGLANKGAVSGYSVAGKTGTAQILFRGRYQSGAGWTNASYAGFAPVEDPKFVIIIKLERPRSDVYGGQTSGEMFSQISSYLFDYYGIPKSRK